MKIEKYKISFDYNEFNIKLIESFIPDVFYDLYIEDEYFGQLTWNLNNEYCKHNNYNINYKTNIDSLFNKNDFSLELNKRLEAIDGRFYYIYKYDENIREILISELKTMLNTLNGVNIGAILMCDINDKNDLTNYKNDLKYCCDGSLIKDVSIGNTTFRIFIEYE